jgi:hypothetical protein
MLNDKEYYKRTFNAILTAFHLGLDSEVISLIGNHVGNELDAESLAFARQYLSRCLLHIKHPKLVATLISNGEYLDILQSTIDSYCHHFNNESNNYDGIARFIA